MKCEVYINFFVSQDTQALIRREAMPYARKFNAHEKRRIGAGNGWRCAVCTNVLEATYHADHIIPLHKGGADTLENAQPLCVKCHADKTQREEIERLEKSRSKQTTMSSLMCCKCQQIVSPYFTHKCPTPRGDQSC